jgi:hypothetical protein
MSREQMVDKVVRINGFENKWTLWFCELAENKSVSDDALRKALSCALVMSMIEEEEEEK